MKTNRLAVIHRACTCTLVTISLCGQAQAQPEPDPGLPAASEDAPKRAPDSPSRRAEALFAEGVVLFKQWRFDEAEQKFREALTYREHPLIHLYLSRALEKQGHLVEAHQALQQALHPGGGPLPPEDVRVAEDLQQSLEARLAEIEVSCDVPGAEVSLDGEPWFTAPGRQRRMVTAGQHVIIARKASFFPVAEPVSLIPGKQTRVVLRMTADVVRIERHWRPWQPWTVVGAGIAMSLASGWFRQQAARDYASFEDALDSCRQTLSCQMVSTQRLDSGKWKDRVSTRMLSAGGIVVATGLVGVILNQPRTWRSKPARSVPDLDLAPMITSDAVGISTWIRF